MKFLSNLQVQSYTKFDYLFGAVLLCYPALLFLVKGGMNGSLFLIAAFSIFWLVRYKVDDLGREDKFFAIAMSSGLFAILISQLYHHDMAARYFDAEARFLLAIPILLVLRRINEGVLTVVQYAFPFGAIAAFVAVMIKDPNVRFNDSISYINHIHMGDLTLMLGFLSLFSISWTQQDHQLIKLFKVMGFVAGLAVSILSGARGGWVAIPVFLAIFIHFRAKGKALNKIGLVILLAGIIGLLGYFLVDQVRARLWSIYSDLTLFTTGQVDTSLGVRIQLWKAAFHLIAENPILGVGADGFGRAMDMLSASGFVTPAAATFGKGEVHNEILAHTVRFGVFGLFSILAIYFVPAILFLRAANSGTHQQKTAAMLGMCLTLGFFIFGLSVETFDLKMTAAFYSLTVAILLAAATRKSVTAESFTTVSQGNNV